MHHRTPAALVSSALAALVAGCAANRQAAPPAIPEPLASALITNPFSSSRGEANFAVGKLPAAYPVRLVPSGPVTIVGGMTTRDETVAVFADSTRRLAAVFQQLFEQAGYARPPQSPSRGFSSPVGPSISYCGDSGTVSVEPLTGSNRTFARVQFRPSHTGNPCRAMERVIQPNELTLPPLAPPPGAHVGRWGGNGGTSVVSSNAEITGADLVPSAIVAHYAAQLVAAGWTAETPAISDHVAAQWFAAKDSSGAPWDGVLVASGSRSKLNLALTMNPRGGR